MTKPMIRPKNQNLKPENETSMIPKQMFITDLDGTLFTDSRKISPIDWNALAELGRAGIIRVIATGRSSFSFFRAMDLLGYGTPSRPLPVDYLIFSTGAGVMELPGRTIIKKSALSVVDITEITTYFNRKQMDYMVHGPVPHTRKFLFKCHGKENTDFNARIALYPDCGRPLTPCSRADFYPQATEVLAIVPREKSMGVAQKTIQDLARFSVIKATSPLDHTSIWIEVFSGEVSKSRTAAWLARRHGIRRENILAIGNDYNDLDLLEWAGTAMVVANAPETVRQNFKVVPSNNHNGVARAAEHFLSPVSAVPV